MKATVDKETKRLRELLRNMSAEALALRIADRNPQGFEVMLAREELQSRFHQHELALEPNVWQEQWMKSTIIITAGTAIIAAIIWSGW